MFGGTGLSHTSTPRPFYVKFTRLEESQEPNDWSVVEVLFNPEWVVVDGRMTDVIMILGRGEDLEREVAKIVRDLRIEFCPPELESALNEALFAVESRDVKDVDVSSPWSIAFDL